MHLAQQSHKSSNGESLLGLIDGAQAIVLTLLVIEMPVLIIEIIEHAGSIENLYFNLGMDVVGYFLSAVVIYDIWSIQKKAYFSRLDRVLVRIWLVFLRYGFQRSFRHCYTLLNISQILCSP